MEHTLVKIVTILKYHISTYYYNFKCLNYFSKNIVMHKSRLMAD